MSASVFVTGVRVPGEWIRSPRPPGVEVRGLKTPGSISGVLVRCFAGTSAHPSLLSQRVYGQTRRVSLDRSHCDPPRHRGTSTPQSAPGRDLLGRDANAWVSSHAKVTENANDCVLTIAIDC